MRISKRDIHATIDGLNRACQRAGLPGDYLAEYANGGYKLTQGAGERDIWNDRCKATEFYHRVWAYRAGMEAAQILTLTKDDLALCEGMAAELLAEGMAQGKGQGQTAGAKLDRARMSDMQTLKVKCSRLLEA